MRGRVRFALSLLAALGIHAVILLVPRAALVGETKVLPTVEIDLSETPAIMAMSTAAAPAPLPAPPALLPLQVRPAPREAHEPEPPASTPEAAPERLAETAPIMPPDPTPALLPETESAAVQTVRTSPAAGTAAPSATPAANASGSAGSDRGSASTAADGPSSGSESSSAASGPNLVAPQPRAPILPPYPRSARLSGAQGLVKVSAMVDERGTVTSAEVLLSSGSSLLDRAALDAVRRAAFVPALRGGLPVACRVVVPIRFQLSAAVR